MVFNDVYGFAEMVEQPFFASGINQVIVNLKGLFRR